jgi:hypothetical protein
MRFDSTNAQVGVDVAGHSASRADVIFALQIGDALVVFLRTMAADLFEYIWHAGRPSIALRPSLLFDARFGRTANGTIWAKRNCHKFENLPPGWRNVECSIRFGKIVNASIRS